MVRHFILMSSSYKEGIRIALDFTAVQLDSQYILSQIEKIKQACGANVSLSTHFIDAKHSSWDSVVEADSFFKDVVVVNTVDEFIALVKADLSLTGLDVAKYILSKISCTHLKLQKMTYLCYADYLCVTQKKLFEDKIYAFKFGPVVDSVYQQFKSSGYENIEEHKKDIFIGSVMLPVKSRVLFSIDGINKIKSIDKSIEKYGIFTANELVEITHKSFSPWSMTPQSQIIEDDIIKAYHSIES